MSSIEDKLSSKLYEVFVGPPGNQDLRRSLLKLPCRGIKIGTPGTLVVVRPDGVEVPLTTVVADTFEPVQAIGLRSVGAVGGGAEGSTSDAEDVTVYW